MSYNENGYQIPTVYVALTYDCLYDDYDTVNVHELLYGIPSICILNYIVREFYKVAYSLSDNSTQRKMIRNMCNHLKGEPRKRIWNFLNKHKHSILIETYGLLMMEALILKNWTPVDTDEETLDLCEDEYEPVYKALLYCNKQWTDLQTKGFKNNKMIDVSLLLEIPIAEFKFYKDFETQMYKAIKFFEFCESDKVYNSYLSYFYHDHKIDSWKQYVLRLFEMMRASLKNPYVTIDEKYPNDRLFFDQYIIVLDDCRKKWEDFNSIAYLRNHFLLKLNEKSYMVLNCNLLVDKFYQGLKFDFYTTLKNHYLKNAKGKVIASYADFSSCFGKDFSEPLLLHSLMTEIFADKVDAIYTGDLLKDLGVVAEPDLYMRIGDSLYLFEYKDVTLSDEVKFSADSNTMKNAICDRICKYDDGYAKKGAGQLHFTMENIFLKGSMDKIDPDVKQIKSVFPIIMTTDRCFSAMGVNLVVIEEYAKILKTHPIKTPVFISIPIIMGIDAIIKCAHRFNNGTYDLNKMFRAYIDKNNLNLVPFDTFVQDNYLRKYPFDEENTKFLFGDFIDHVSLSS